MCAMDTQTSCAEWRAVESTNGREALRRAVEVAGGQTALARALSTGERPIRQGHVWAWLNRENGVLPSEFVLRVESLTGVSRHELRSDVFGPEGCP